jgi:hypothetical protein
MKLQEKRALGMPLTQGEQAYLVLLKTLGAAVIVAIFNAASQFIASHGTSFDWLSLGYTVLIAGLIAAIVAGLTYVEAQPVSPQNVLIVEVLQSLLDFLRQMPPAAAQPLEVHVHMPDGTVRVDQVTTQVVPAVRDLTK